LNISLIEQIDRFRQILNEKEHDILIVSHRNPDGDAMGASLALYNLFITLGHKVNVIVPNSYPQYVNWIKGIDKSLVYEKNVEKCNAIFEKSNIVFAVDFNDLSRVREYNEHLLKNKSFKILIDHHPNPAPFADLSYSDTSVSSASELVYLFIKKLGYHNLLNKDIAESIYAGILTDTGCFSFNSSKKQTFDVVADLLSFGIEKDKIYSLVYDNYSYDRMKLMGHCLLNKLVYLPEYKTAYMSLTQADMKKFNFRIGDSEGFANLPLSIKGVRLAVLFTEKEDIVRLSFRSRGQIAVNEIASKHYEGGGHYNAAGGESKEKLEKTIANFLQILPKYKDQLLHE
jgi:bifunctional oligoribonuclease and PAP phosphatase NrnA